MEAMEAQWEAERETERQKMVEILQFMQTLGARTGVPMPPSLFAPPQPPAATPVSISMNVLVCMLMLMIKTQLY